MTTPVHWLTAVNNYQCLTVVQCLHKWVCSAMLFMCRGTRYEALLSLVHHKWSSVTLIENNDKFSFNWSLLGTPQIGQGKLVDCNQIQGHFVIAVFQLWTHYGTWSDTLKFERRDWNKSDWKHSAVQHSRPMTVTKSRHCSTAGWIRTS